MDAPNTKKLIRKALDKQYRFDGTVMTVRERIESLHKSGLKGRILAEEADDRAVQSRKPA